MRQLPAGPVGRVVEPGHRPRRNDEPGAACPTAQRGSRPDNRQRQHRLLPRRLPARGSPGAGLLHLLRCPLPGFRLRTLVERCRLRILVPARVVVAALPVVTVAVAGVVVVALARGAIRLGLGSRMAVSIRTGWFHVMPNRGGRFPGGRQEPARRTYHARPTGPGVSFTGVRHWRDFTLCYRTISGRIIKVLAYSSRGLCIGHVAVRLGVSVGHLLLRVLAKLLYVATLGVTLTPRTSYSVPPWFDGNGRNPEYPDLRGKKITNS